MKMIAKSSLEFIDGMLVDKEGNVYMPSIARLANDLETACQHRCYINMVERRKKPTKIPEFKRISIDDDIIPEIEAKTPTLDKKRDEAMALMDELDAINMADKANNDFEYYCDLIKFVSSDKVLVDSDCYGMRFDTPILGDPLKWDKDYVIDAIKYANGILDDDDDMPDVIAVGMDSEKFHEIMEMLNDILGDSDNEEDENNDGEPEQTEGDKSGD